MDIQSDTSELLPGELREAEVVIAENWLTQKPDQSASLITLISTLIVVFGSQVYWGNLLGIAFLMPASHQSIFMGHEFWRAWTTLLVHADQKHLIGNLFLFYILGFFLNGYFGVFVFPFMAFVLGGFINFVVLWDMPQFSNLIGLSGVVFWMGGVWLTLYFLLERRKSIVQRILRTVGVSLVLFMPSEAFDPNISYKAHFVGFLFGIIFGLFFFFYKRSEFYAVEVNQVIIESYHR